MPNFNIYLPFLAVLIGLINASILSEDSKPLKLPFTNEKNDDSHLRLYYKSNSPSQSISHELEHRFVKSPNYRFDQRINQENANFQSKLNPEFGNPSSIFGQNMPFTQPQDQQNLFLDSTGKNKQTMVNLHYHGNSFQGLDSQQMQMLKNQPSAARKNLIKMLLMNFSPSSSNSLYSQEQLQQQMLQQQQQQQQQSRMQFKPIQFDAFSNQQAKNEDGLQYKIVHLKFKIQPQLGRVVGQGFVETDNGAGSILNAKRFSLLPREVPDLVRRLLMSTQQQEQQQMPPIGMDASFPFLENFHVSRTTNLGNFNKREENSDSYSEESNANYEKREDSNENNQIEAKNYSEKEILIDNNHNNQHLSVSKRFKKTEDQQESEEKIKSDKDDNEVDELNKKLKSLRRRDDIEDEYSSLSERSDNDNDSLSSSIDDSERKILSRNDEDSNLSDE